MYTNGTRYLLVQNTIHLTINQAKKTEKLTLQQLTAPPPLVKNHWYSQDSDNQDQDQNLSLRPRQYIRS